MPTAALHQLALTLPDVFDRTNRIAALFVFGLFVAIASVVWWIFARTSRWG